MVESPWTTLTSASTCHFGGCRVTKTRRLENASLGIPPSSDTMETVPDRVQLKSIASVFSPVAIRAMAESLRCRRLRQVASKARLDSNSYDSVGSLVDQLYKILSAHYRCEYVYKNTLAKKIVSGRHRPHSIAMPSTSLKKSRTQSSQITLSHFAALVGLTWPASSERLSRC